MKSTPRNVSLRNPEKLRYDPAEAYAILDDGYICHIGYAAEGVPRVLPTAYARIDDTLYVHGSTGSRAFLGGRGEGVDVCATVTHHDGIIYSRSWFHHSVNYRCVMAHGRARLVTDATEKWDALAAIVDRLAPGRSRQSRPPTDRELAQTGVLALPLDHISVKTRSGGPNEEPADLELPYWGGELPLRVVPGLPVPDPEARVPVPAGLPVA